MPTASAVIAICVTRYARLDFSDRLNLYLSITKQIVESTTQNRISATVDYCGGFNERRCRYPANRSILNLVGESFRVGFIVKDGDKSRRIKNHLGKPSSSYSRSPCSVDR